MNIKQSNIFKDIKQKLKDIVSDQLIKYNDFNVDVVNNNITYKINFLIEEQLYGLNLNLPDVTTNEIMRARIENALFSQTAILEEFNFWVDTNTYIIDTISTAIQNEIADIFNNYTEVEEIEKTSNIIQSEANIKNPRYIEGIVEPAAFNETKSNIIENSKEILNKLTDNIKDIINPDINDNIKVDQIMNDLKNEVINRATGFTSNINNILNTNINDTIINSINNIFGREDICSGINGNIYDIKNNCIQLLKDTAMNKINSQVNLFGDKVISSINDCLYNNKIPTGIVQSTQEIFSNTINDISNALQGNITSLISNGIIDKNIANNICSGFSNNINNAKSNILNNINNTIQNGIGNVVNKINDNISNIFCEPVRAIDEISGNLGGFIDGIGNIMGGSYTTPGFSGISSSITNPLNGIVNNVNNVTNTAKNLLNDITSTLNKFGNDSIGKISGAISTAASTGNQLNSYVQNYISGNQGNNSAQKITKAGNSVKNRNSRNTNSIIQPKNTSEPQEEQYDNTIPSRAKMRSDPRRDNCQEFVMWETSNRKYVLVRDGKGNYVLLDEDKNCVRIQHTSGSYIQLSANGNIEIESAHHVRINCSGARYIKQY